MISLDNCAVDWTIGTSTLHDGRSVSACDIDRSDTRRPCVDDAYSSYSNLEYVRLDSACTASHLVRPRKTSREPLSCDVVDPFPPTKQNVVAIRGLGTQRYNAPRYNTRSSTSAPSRIATEACLASHLNKTRTLQLERRPNG